MRASTASPVPGSISRFIDPKPEFLFVPATQVLEAAKREGAIPYDIPNVELGHHGPQCSFDAFVDRYQLDDPALAKLAVIVRGADTDDRGLTPESAGLYAAATGLSGEQPRRLRQHGAPVPDVRRALRVLPGGGAGRRRGRACSSSACTAPRRAWSAPRTSASWPPARGLQIDAVAAGTEPDPDAGAGSGEGLGQRGAHAGAGAPAAGHALRLNAASRVVSFGCDITPKAGVAVDQWDVPAVSDGYEAARDRIVEKVERLVAELAGGR